MIAERMMVLKKAAFSAAARPAQLVEGCGKNVADSPGRHGGQFCNGPVCGGCPKRFGTVPFVSTPDFSEYFRLFLGPFGRRSRRDLHQLPVYLSILHV